LGKDGGESRGEKMLHMRKGRALGRNDGYAISGTAKAGFRVANEVPTL